MKQISLKKTITLCSVSAVIAIALGVGNGVAMSYAGLLDVFFSKSDYIASADEKTLCREIVEEGIVLLKNEEKALPLASNEKRVALFGQDSVDFVYGGSGSGAVDTTTAPTLKDSFESAGYTINNTLWDFYKTGAGSSYRKQTPDVSGKGNFAVNEVPQSVYTDAVKATLTDDVAVVCIGRSGGESSDLPTSNLPTGARYLELDKDEKDMLALACSKYSKVVMIINSSNPLECGFLENDAYKNVKAALWVGAVGQEGIQAIGKIFNGEVNPSGRLVDTYAYDSTSAPSYQNFGDYDITNSSVNNGKKYLVYQEGIYVGYRYYETRYEDKVLNRNNAGDYDYSSTVQYPFGYGLSYTDFEWSNFQVEYNSETDEFNYSLDVKNVGDYSGKDVIEIYMQSPYTQYDKDNGIEKSAVELVAFAKTGKLNKNETKKVTGSFERSLLKTYDAKKEKTYIVDEGDYYFTAGINAHNAINNILLAKDVESSKLAGDGNKDLTYKYHVDGLDKTSYTTQNNKKVTNQFDNVDVNYYEECKYLSRADWTGTFPQGAFKNGNWNASSKMLSDLEFIRNDEVLNDGSAMPTWGSTATSYKVQDLATADYDDPRWDDLVNQLTKTQATKLVRLGGYQTNQIDAIGLPKTVDKDGPSGISGTLVGGASCMAWPAEVVMCATWNTQMVKRMGELMGDDSISANVAGWYAPGVNVHRSPYSGRNYEYFSEDGLLSGKIGAAEMQGVRSRGVIAYMKHFALNDQETNRYGAAIFANEQSIREISLKGFELIAKEGKATACMAAMNRIGATWVGAHKGIMTNVLREEWGFQGMVITDQASSSSMFYQDMISGLAYGTDLWLNTNSNFWSLDEYKDNATVQNNVHKAAKNIIYAVTKSNAVLDYSNAESTALNDNSSSISWWRIALVCLDVVVFSACAAGIVLPLTFYFKGKKKTDVE